MAEKREGQARSVIDEFERLDGERAQFKSHWQDCTNYGFPDRSDYILERAPGQKRMTFVYDSTPLMALDQFAAGLHSLLTSATLQWFFLRAEDDRVNADAAGARWMELAAEAMYRLFNSPRHNFASQSYELYMDEGSIGNAVMAVLSDGRGDPLFSTRHLKECCIALNNEDRVDRLTRSWKSWTAKQAVNQWGTEKLKAAGADKVLQAFADGKLEQRFRFLHRVAPRGDRNPARSDRRHMPFESVYVGFDDECVIDDGGFQDFPYLTPRFSKLTGEIYGRGPMMLALPDIKMLNELVKLVVKSAQKVIDPPIWLPDDGFLVPTRTVPGAFNFYRATSQAKPFTLQTEGQVQLGVDMIQGLRQQIIKAMYVEWMIMPTDPRDPAAAGKGVTATYVLQQRDEKMRLLSPMLSRLQAEFLGPLIDRVFNLMWRKSKALGFGPGAPFPAPPPVLNKQPLRVEYVSPIALAQKSAQMDSIARLLQLQMEIKQMDPQSMMIIDSDYIMRLAQRDWNAPAGALKSPDQVAQEQAQKAQAEQALMQHGQLQSMAGAVRDAGAGAKDLAAAHATAQDSGLIPRQAAA